MNHEILNLLFCPSSKEKLALKDDELYSLNTSYPLFNDIPWLFKDPEFHFLEWGTKIESYIKEEDLYINHLQQIASTHENKLSRKRLSKIHEAKIKNLKTLTKTLELFRGHQQIAVAASTQQIHSYFQLIFRDWCWDSAENKSYQDFIEKQMTKDTKNVLVLGAGAANISYELASKYPNSNFISFDHNPFLLLTANKIFNGEEVKLSDYSEFPKDIEHTSKHYKIKVPKLAGDNHQFVLGSFPDLPFKDESFDMIVAPWFFDILNTEYIPSIKHSLRYLTKDGVFAMYGPSNIHKNSIDEQYTAEEVKDYLTTSFEEVKLETGTVNYLHNPLNSQNRIENIMYLVGKKPTVNKQELRLPAKANGLKFDPPFEHYKAVNTTFFNILKHINDDISVDELAKKIQGEFNFNEAESVYYAENFISKLMIDVYQK